MFFSFHDKISRLCHIIIFIQILLGNVVFTFIRCNSDHDVPLALIVIYSFSLRKIFRFKSHFNLYIFPLESHLFCRPILAYYFGSLGIYSGPKVLLVLIDIFLFPLESHLSCRPIAAYCFGSIRNFF
jgi:hypothetical protein